VISADRTPTQRRQQCEPHRPRGGLQVGRVGTSRAGTPRLDQLLRHVSEQVWWQPEAADRVELVDLLEQRLQPDLTGVGLQLSQKLPRSEVFQPFGAVFAQTRDGSVAEPLLERRPRRSDDPIDAPRGFQPLGAASDHQGRT
jgi:hypothetical protein